MNGDVKSLLLSISQDLKILSCRTNKKDSQAKSKYVMELNEIHQIVRGHGTVAFENSKGIYRGGKVKNDIKYQSLKSAFQ